MASTDTENLQHNQPFGGLIMAQTIGGHLAQSVTVGVNDLYSKLQKVPIKARDTLISATFVSLQIANFRLMRTNCLILTASNFAHNNQIFQFNNQHIHGQGRPDVKNVKMGLYESDYNGCGWIATYNALISMDTPKHPAKIIKYFERTGGMNILGQFGTNPIVINQYLRFIGHNTEIIYHPQNLDYAIHNSKNGVGIFLFFADMKTVHYVMIQHKIELGNSMFYIYNEFSNVAQKDGKISIDEWFREKTNALPISLIIFK